MSINYRIVDLVSLLKVFDCRYATDEEYEKVHGLNVNVNGDVEKVVVLLLEPQFKRYAQQSQDRLINTLEHFCSKKDVNFDKLFEEISFIFDDEIIDKKAFLQAMLSKLKS